MSDNLSPALNVLYCREEEMLGGMRRTLDVLSVDAPLRTLLISKDRRLGPGRFDELLDKTSTLLGSHRVQRSVTDWPFEHFWGNPYEPKHSKLLGYFTNPHEEHGSGAYLLRALFAALQATGVFSEKRFPVDQHVFVKSGLIDLSIERDRDDGRYAFIIENKINWAVDQENQLQRYVARFRKRNFKPSEIYVLYLPLNKHKSPDSEDLAAIMEVGVNYERITFEDHISTWLRSVLSVKAESNWPSSMKAGMCDNLRHYLNLITFLTNKQKEQSMDTQLLKQLARADAKNELPTWAQVRNLIESATSLQQCVESSLRGRLLLRVKELLEKQGVHAWFYLDEDPSKERTISSAFDEAFGDEQNLCVRVNDTVCVCIGGHAEEPVFWFGYMHTGKANESDLLAPVVMIEAKLHLSDCTKLNRPWFVWDWDKEVRYENCGEEATAKRVVGKLIEMRDGVVKALGGANVKKRARNL